MTAVAALLPPILVSAVPFYRLAALIRTQVTARQKDTAQEMTFRVAIKDGKLAFAARAFKGAPR
jgi:hypothetical protein